MHYQIVKIAVVLSIFSFSNVSNGAVTEWAFAKGIGGRVTADNQEPSATSWDVEVYVRTDAAGDASSVAISGGGIDGSLDFELDGTEWTLEEEFFSEAAMDAVFPNNTTYTITLSGGTLGTLTQAVTVGAKAYPSLPYLTGSGFSILHYFDPTESFDLVFAAPSSEADMTQVEIGEVGEEAPFDAFVPASQTTINLPADTLSGGKTYQAYADHLNQSLQSGTGGFGVAGYVWHTAYSLFEVDASASGSIIGGWTYGDSTQEGSGVVVLMKDGTYFHVEDVRVSEGNQDGFERGTYTWNESTGTFVATPVQDLNGESGLSHPEGITTVEVTGNTLTYSDAEGSTVMSRVFDANNPLVGAWQFGEGRAFDSRVAVFLANGVYFEAQTTDPQVSPDGMEKGTYLWDEAMGAFEATLGIDTNGAVGFSDPAEGFSLSILNDELLVYERDREWRLYLVSPNTPGLAVPAVTQWKISKSRDSFQKENNTAPSISNWSVNIVVETKLNLDATEIEIRGDGIDDSYPLVQIGRVWTFEKDYPTEAAMNAEFPAGGELTIELSGGNLGTMTQVLNLLNDQYPKTPYLTGTKFTAAQSFDSFADFPLSWSSPGDLTANSGQVAFEVYRYYHDERVYRTYSIEGSTQGNVPAGTVFPGHTFYGYLEYTHARPVTGNGGFEIAGTDSRIASTDFTLATAASPLAGTWSFGDESSDGSGVLVFLNNGTYYHIEDVADGESDPDGFELGTYEWDRDSGVFSLVTFHNTNGTVGLSDSGESLSIVVSGDSLTLNDGDDVSVLTKVNRTDDNIVGGWQSSHGNAGYGEVLVFFDSGYYFFLGYSEPLGHPLDAGIERGSYTWDPESFELTATAITDTNGEAGLSHGEGIWTANVSNNSMSVADNRGVYSGFDTTMAELENHVLIIDDKLLAAFRNTLGKASGPILRLDLQRILKMNASGLGIEDGSGFEEAINMRQLKISNNALSEAWYFGGMLDLQVLDLSNNEIASLSGLSELKKLVNLNVSSNQLYDQGTFSQSKSGVGVLEATGVLAPLEGITTLDTLKFANNGIRDLDVLTTLPALRVVDLSGNQIEDLASLEELTQLQRLSVYGNPLDLSQGSSQRNLLDTIATNTGAVVFLDAPDPYATYLSWEWDNDSGKYRLIWSEPGTLQRSSDMSNWTDEGNALSPYLIDSEVEEPIFWKLDF